MLSMLLNMCSFLSIKILFVFYVARSIQSEPLHFPENFKFGVATAAYQIEGAWRTEGKGENIWDRLTHEHPDWISDHTNGDVACDSYHKIKDDVALLKHLNVGFYRFSISWSRLLPTGYANKINPDGIRYYNDLINELVANNIIPLVTLYHWDLPQPLQEIGGWPNEILADFFVDYARVIFKNFGDRVKHWITFNEPPEICQGGYGDGDKAPGYHSDGIGIYMCGRTLLLAHGKAYHMYNKEFLSTQGGRMGITIDANWFEPKTNSTEDVEAAERCMQMGIGWWAHPIFSKEGDYPEIMKKRIGDNSKMENFPKSRLPPFLEEEIKLIRGTYDFFGLNFYSSRIATVQNSIHNIPSYWNDVGATAYLDPNWPPSAAPWLKVTPWGLRKLLAWIKKEYDNPVVIITENGFADLGELNDVGRINYMNLYLKALLDAIHIDGCKVDGYAAWSLMDNFEWFDGYSIRFGLYHVDFNSPNKTRTPKSSVEFYRKVIQDKCVDDNDLF